MTTPLQAQARLPELPASNFSRNGGNFATLYTAEHMRSYALAAIAAKEAEAGRLRGILSGVVELARDAHAHWDGDRDAKVGKLLLALAGHVPRYDPRADALHAALTNKE